MQIAILQRELVQQYTAIDQKTTFHASEPRKLYINADVAIDVSAEQTRINDKVDGLIMHAGNDNSAPVPYVKSRRSMRMIS